MKHLRNADAPPVVLASQSRFRREMLERAGLEFAVDAAHVDESEIKLSMRQAGASVEDVATALAEHKARRVALRHPGTIVIGSDQMLDCGGVWFDKPADRAHAEGHLRALSGKTHRLVTAAVVFRNGTRVWHHTESAKLTMRPLEADFIRRYLDAMGEDAGSSVGAYQLEGLGAQLFSRVEGDFFVILGLPLLPLLGFLRAQGVIPE
ncbi:MAG: Maf family protein [Rhodospirillales bacterium]|nr:Maf family protein [Rhodospirillales bacterium]